MLHDELLHIVLDIRVTHDKGTQSSGHIQCTVFLSWFGVCSQNIIDKPENGHESRFGPASDQLEEEGGGSGHRCIKVVVII